MILNLLSVKWISFRNTILRGSLKESRSAWAGIFFTLVLAAFVGFVSYSFLAPFANLSRSNPSLATALTRIPAFTLFTAFWMLLLSAVTVSIQKFYLSPEIPLLLSAPIPPRTLLLAKLSDCTFANASLFLLLGIPMAAAYGSANEISSPSYFGLVALVLFAFSLLPTSIG